MRGYGADAFRVEDVAEPTVRRGEVRVRVMACGANASDWEFATGRPFYGRLARMVMRVRVAGSDVAGVVDAVGEGVTGFSVGDRVVADTFESFGGFAGFCVAKADRWVRLPDDMDFTTAAALPQSGAIAIEAFEGKLATGQRVLINGGGGGSGVFAIQLAKRAGAHVTGVDNAAKLDFMRSLGADEVVDYRHDDFTRQRDFTRGGYDLILDMVAHRSVFAYRRALNRGGHYGCVGGTVPTLLRILTAGVVVGAAVDDVLVEDVATTAKTFTDFAGAWSALFGR